jgi:hypothetical protein
MAAAATHIASTSILLKDRFQDKLWLPAGYVGGFTGDLNNVSTQVIAPSSTIPNSGFTLNESAQIGTKVKIYDPVTLRSATFIYGKLVKHGGVATAAGSFVATAYATSNSTFVPAYFTDSPDYWMNAAGFNAFAVCVSAMTEGDQGWFLCGGQISAATSVSAIAYGFTALAAATVKGYIDVSSVTGASAYSIGDVSTTDEIGMVAPSAYGQETDVLAFTVMTNT